MCNEIVVYASACVLRSKMTCARKLDYSEEEVRSVNLTHSSSTNCAQRQDTGQDIWRWVRMQWMTVTSLVPYRALHVPHVAVSVSEPLNLMISSTPSTETVFAYLDQAYPDTQVLFWNYLFLDDLLATAEGIHLTIHRFCLETCKPLGGLSNLTNEFPLPS